MSVIQFYSKSSPCLPGLGKGETLAKGESFPKGELPTNFRQMLSNFYTKAPFQVNGLKFQSIEHGFHYYKVLSTGKPLLAHQYTLEGALGTESPAKVKASTGKSKFKMTLEEIENWQKEQPHRLLELARAQYTQHPNMMAMLKATGNARLMHFERGKPLVHFWWLEEIRLGFNFSSGV